MTYMPPTWSCCVASHCCQCVAEEGAHRLLIGGGGQTTNIHTARVTSGLLRVLRACGVVGVDTRERGEEKACVRQVERRGMHVGFHCSRISNTMLHG